MEFTTRILKCVDCGEEFVFSAGEQVFFRKKQFQQETKHAINARQSIKMRAGASKPASPARCAAPVQRFRSGPIWADWYCVVPVFVAPPASQRQGHHSASG